MSSRPKRFPAAADKPTLAAWILAGITLLLVIKLHLLPTLLAGLLVHQLIHLLSPLIARRLSSQRAKIVSVALLAGLVVGLTTFGIVGAVAFFRSDAGSLTALFQKMADILDSTRQSLPAWLFASLPTTADEVREALNHWLREHAPEVQLVGMEAGRVFAHILVGMIIGAMAALHEICPTQAPKPLALALTERARRLGNAFRRVVFAQVRISAINTAFTAIYLLLVLPLFGVHLPLVKTMVALTFVIGLVPVLGNLVSNAVIVVVSLAHSPQVAAASLLFLVVIHKGEYFLNARIVGSSIHSKAWEILLAMLTMEAAFGLPGVIAAPIYYAYVKDELINAGMV